MAKPPKDPTTPPSKPAARRAPRNAAAKPTARRAPAAPTPAPAPPPAQAEAPKAPPPTPPKAAPAKTASPAKPPRAAAPSRAAPSRAKPARPAAKAPRQAVAALPKITLKAVPGTATAWTIGAIVAAAGTGVVAFLTRGRIAKLLSRSAPAEGHVPTDLLDPDRDGPVKHGDERAPAAFRPDMDAPMTAAEREALRPATGPAPTLTSDRGTMNAQTGPSD